MRTMLAATLGPGSPTSDSSSRGRRGERIRHRSVASISAPRRHRRAWVSTVCAGTSRRNVPSPMPGPSSPMLSALSTDLYELTMIGGYYVAGLSGRATFDLFVRQLPPTRNYLIAAGLEQALDFLESLQFTADEIAYLRTVPALANLPHGFFDDYLAGFRFTGDVFAINEGTPVFAQEPLMRITAPLAEAQLVETALIAEVMFPTSVASRASRVVDAAAGRSVMEFGARRAHGIDAGIRAARAAYIAGFDSSSIVEAGRRFGIPLSGTLAHSWVMAFADERRAFGAYAEVFGDEAVFILDTYDAIAAARLIAESGMKPRAV